MVIVKRRRNTKRYDDSEEKEGRVNDNDGERRQVNNDRKQ